MAVWLPIKPAAPVTKTTRAPDGGMVATLVRGRMRFKPLYACSVLPSLHPMHAEATCNARDRSDSASATDRRPELLALTSVRFFAALEVVLLHTLYELGGEEARAIPLPIMRLFTRGELAVSFFFVLSGFILAYTYCDRTNDLKTTPKTFWRARFARIYPLYFLGFVMDLPRVSALFLGSVASLSAAVIKIGVAALAYLLLVQSWHPRVTNTWNTPGWTLSVEAFFYALFPLLLRLTRNWTLRRLCLVALAIWALPLILDAIVFRDASSPVALTFSRSFPPLRLPEFFLGVAAGRVFLTKRFAPHRTALRIAGALALGLIVAIALTVHLLPVALESTLSAPLFALAIIALASDAIPTPRWLNGSGFVLLGRASYAVYILHQPFKQLFLMFAAFAGLGSPGPTQLLCYLVSLQLFCIALFLWFEDPARRLITRSRAS